MPDCLTHFNLMIQSMCGKTFSRISRLGNGLPSRHMDFKKTKTFYKGDCWINKLAKTILNDVKTWMLFKVIGIELGWHLILYLVSWYALLGVASSIQNCC